MRSHFYLLPYPLSYHIQDGIFGFMAKQSVDKDKTKKPIAASQESFGLPGKTYPVSANAVKTTTFLPENKTKSLAGMQGSSNFKNRSIGETANMAVAVTSVAGLAKAMAAKKIAQTAVKTAADKVSVPLKKRNSPGRIPSKISSRQQTMQDFEKAKKSFEILEGTEKAMYTAKVPNLRFRSDVPNRFRAYGPER